MAVFELYLDDNQMFDVPKFNEFIETLERDRQQRGLVFKYPNTLKMFGDAYKYLYDQWVDGGFCGTVDVIIQKIEDEGRKTRINAKIFLSDVEWEWDTGSVEVSLEDDSWSARIINNIRIPVNLLAVETKNGETMTPATVLDVEFYNPQLPSPIYLPTTRKGIQVTTAFTALLAFVSDNVIDFQSDYLNDEDGILLTTGNAIRTGVKDTYVVTLEQLLRSVMTLHNLWFELEDNSDGTFTFRLENEEFFYDEEVTERFSRVKGVKQAVMADLLFGSVTVGGEAEKDLNGTLSLPYFQMTTHAQEEYYFNGVCNVEDTMDLGYEVITDTNAIEDVAVNGNTDYDDNLFLVYFNRGTLQAIKYKFADDGNQTMPPFYYNEPFLNSNILNRHQLPNNVIQTFGTDDDQINVELGSDSGIQLVTQAVQPVLYQTEISDVNNNYNPATGFYTAPAAGTYTFQVGIYTLIRGNDDNEFPLTIRAQMQKRNSGGTAIELYEGPLVEIFGRDSTGNYLQAFEHIETFVVYMDAGSTVEARMDFIIDPDAPVGFSYEYFRNCFMKCIATFTGGGEFIAQNPNNYRAILLTFEEGMSDERWARVKDTKSTKFEIDRNGRKLVNGWLHKFDRNILTGEVDCQVITNLAQGNKIGV